MKFDKSTEFQKEYKKLKKKYRSLPNDLKVFEQVLSKFHTGVDRHSVILVDHPEYSVVKSRLFCRYLKGSSLRIVFFYLKKEKCVFYIELFYKGDKQREEKERIKKYEKVFTE